MSSVQLLDVDRSASTDEVKWAYKKLALAYHPDKQRHATEEQQAAIQMKFQEIREAFDVLSDEELRSVYDRVRDYMASLLIECVYEKTRFLCRKFMAIKQFQVWRLMKQD